MYTYFYKVSAISDASVLSSSLCASLTVDLRVAFDASTVIFFIFATISPINLADIGAQPCNVFALLEHSFHDFSCSRCPASVLNECHCPVLQIVCSKVKKQRFHRGKYSGIVCRCRKNNMRASECFGYNI